MAGGVEYQVTKVDPTNPETKGMVYQVHKVTEEVAATLGGKVYRARIIKDPTEPTVAGKVYQIVLIGDPDDPAVKGKVYNAILIGDSEVVVVGPAVSPLSLSDAIADSLSYVKAFGGTEQRNLPDDYTQLEYIESSGTQYIDIDVSGNAIFIGTAQSTTDSPTTSQVLVANGGAGAGRWFGVQSPGAGTGFAKRWGLGASASASTTIDGTTKVDFEITFSDVDGQYGTINDQTITRTTSMPTQTDWIAFAGTTTSSYGFIGKVWGLKVVQNDVLVRNLIPAKNSSNVVGMYDTANDVFYQNAGTGDFVAGDPVVPTPTAPIPITCNNGVLKARHQSGLPLGYTLLDYIETDGKSWFATGINVDATTELEITASNITSSSTQLMVARTIPTGKYFRLAKASASQRLIGSVGNQTITDLNNDGANKFTAKVNISSFYVDGTLIGNFASATPDLSEMTEIDVFKGTYGNNTYYAGAGSRLYRAVIRKNGVAVIDLIPCRNASNVIGMYDLVSGQFFTNAGTGDFVAGSTASDPVEIYTDGTVETIKDSLNNTATAEMLLKVGDYQDEQEILSGVITRNVGVKVLDGTENWNLGSSSERPFYLNNSIDGSYALPNTPFCTHFQGVASTVTSLDMPDLTIRCGYEGFARSLYIKYKSLYSSGVAAFKQFLADQYAAGTPVTIVYPLATPTTESVTGQTLQVTNGDNILEITQASLSGLELEAEYEKEGA